MNRLRASVVATAVLVAACSSQSNHPAVKAQTNGPLLLSQRIAVGAKQDNNIRLALLDVHSRAVRGLTPDAVHPTDGVVSPDGKHVAYVAVTSSQIKPGVYESHGTVHIAGVTGSGDQTVFRCHEVCKGLAWSPDGIRIVAADAGGVVVIDLSGGSHRVCGSICGPELSQPTWSSDGSRIAFAQEELLGKSKAFGSTVYRVSAIWTVGSDGSGLTQLTDRGCALTHVDRCTLDTAPSWSPTGAQIAIVRTAASRSQVGSSQGPAGLAHIGEISIISSDGTGTTRMIGCGQDGCRASRPAWSPDGSHLAFIDGATQIGGPGRVIVVALPRDSQVTMPPPQDDKNTYFAALAWSPDSSQLAMLLSHGYHSRVLIGRANGADLTELSVPDVRGWDDATFAWATTP